MGILITGPLVMQLLYQSYMSRLHWKILLPQPDIHIKLQGAVNACAHRHAEEHAHHAEKASAHQDGENHPQAGKARFVSQEFSDQ